MIDKKDDHRTYSDLINNRTPPYIRAHDWFFTIVGLLSLAIRLPMIGIWIQRSFTMVCLALSRMRRKGQYAELYSLLMTSLLTPAFREKKNHRWWYLMRFGVAIAQERQINWYIRDLVLENNLILAGTLGPKPWKGYDVAYSFVGYSLWLFERGDIQGSINMIQMAVEADKTWGYPEYLYGWYGLFTRGIDSVSHFTRAVKIDWAFLQRMKQDRTCRQYPAVLREVQKRTLVGSKEG